MLNKIDTVQFLKDLNKPRGDGLKVGLKTALHDGQIKLLAPLYDPNITLVMAPSARKFGKSQVCLYAAWRHCCLNPNSVVYLVGPEKTHIADIYWDAQRAQRFLEDDSDKYILKIKDRERMVVFKNGSIIKLMGSENWKAGQGLTPDFIIYDEFKAFHPKFHTEMAPNVAARGAKLLIVGTHPQAGDRNKTEYESILDHIKANPQSSSYAEYSTFDNPIMNLPAQKKAIEDHIAQLRAAGDEATVQREYYSKIIPGGSRAIFPMFSREKHVKRHEFIMSQIKGNERQFQWFVSIDPASHSVYGGAFIAYHERTKQVFILDELYIQDRMETSTKRVIPLIKAKCMELYPSSHVDDWMRICDEQASIHMVEIISNYPDMAFMPSQKLKNDKSDMHMILKDMMNLDLFVVSDRCVNTIKEIESYATDTEGRLVKNRHSKDHVIDALCYWLHHANYSVADAYEIKKELKDYNWAVKGFSSFGSEYAYEAGIEADDYEDLWADEDDIW